MRFGGQSMVAPLGEVIVKRPLEAYGSTARIQAEWKSLGYLGPPDLARASDQHARFVSILTDAGARALYLPENTGTGLDSIYTHDPALITDGGALIFQTGKPVRRGEGPALEGACGQWGVPILGTLDGQATAESGDMLWLDAETLVVGESFRTNGAGILGLRRHLEPRGINVVSVALPYWHGPNHVLHLMSLISLLDTDLAVVFRPLLPVPLLELLDARSIQLVDTPEAEFATLATNVLAISPRNTVMVSGNPGTRSRLEKASCQVFEFDGSEICHLGSGGPTCLTRPLLRRIEIEVR